MQLKTILNSIEKQKGFVYGSIKWSDSKSVKEIEIEIQPRLNASAICSGCGKKRPGYDRLKPRRYVAKDRTEASLNGFFDILDQKTREGIKFACTDMWAAYLKVVKDMAKTLLKHESLLLNWFESQGLSSGVVEGFNNKAKLTMRKAYGFKEYKSIEIALYHQLGKLPEPKSTHRFW